MILALSLNLAMCRGIVLARTLAIVATSHLSLQLTVGLFYLLCRLLIEFRRLVFHAVRTGQKGLVVSIVEPCSTTRLGFGGQFLVVCCDSDISITECIVARLMLPCVSREHQNRYPPNATRASINGMDAVWHSPGQNLETAPTVFTDTRENLLAIRQNLRVSVLSRLPKPILYRLARSVATERNQRTETITATLAISSIIAMVSVLSTYSRKYQDCFSRE